MKQITLENSAPSTKHSALRPNGAGGVTLRKAASASAAALRCLGCAHLHAEESKLGFKRSTCLHGRYMVGGFLRLYSDHELQFPSRELLAIATACPDHQPTTPEVTPWL